MSPVAIVHAGAPLITADERQRLDVLVPDPLVRTEVMHWLEETRASTDLASLLFAGHVRASVVDGELKFELTETGRGAIERRLALGGGVRLAIDGGA